MDTTPRRATTHLAAVLLGLFASLPILSWAATESETVEKSFKVGGSAKVQVQGFNGSITVREGSKDTVEVKCTKYVQSLTGIGARQALEKIVVEMTQDGDRIKIEARTESGSFLRNCGANFDLEIPESAEVSAKTTNGSIRMHDIRGGAELRTTNGSIVVEDGSGKLLARTTNGSIMTEFDGDLLDLETTNGAITIDGKAREVKANSTNGRICVELGKDPSEVALGTTNGSIHFEGGLKGNSEFRSTNGSITLQLPAQLAFEIDAATSNGSVRNKFKMDQIESQKKRELRARRGQDGASIKVRTSNSSITIDDES